GAAATVGGGGGRRHVPSGLRVQVPQRQHAVAEGEDVQEAVDAVFAAGDEGDDVEGFGWGCHVGLAVWLFVDEEGEIFGGVWWGMGGR
ncbi:hypothetical protein V492_08305, partial [Pseudogymnoascus sp. VKM F-4246]